MDIQVKNYDNEKIATTWEVTVEAKDNKEIEESVLKEIQSEANLPGFRQGKAPFSVLKRKFGEFITNRLLEQQIKEAYTQIISSNKWVGGNPAIDLKSETIELDKDLIFEITLDGPPIVELGDYTGLAVTKTQYTCTKAHIKEELEKLRQQKADYIELDDTAVKKNHFVSINYNYFLMHRDEEQDDTGRFQIGISDPRFGDLEKSVTGMKLNEEKTVPITIPGWVANESIRNKEGNVYIKVIKIEEMQLPELDDEFAKDLNVESFEKLKADIEEYLNKECDRRSKDETVHQIIDAVIDSSNIKIPESMIEKIAEDQMSALAQKFNMDYNTFKMMLESTKDSDEKRKLIDGVKDDAHKSLLHQLTYSKIIELENIECTDEDVQNKKEEIAKTWDTTVDKIDERINEQEEFLTRMKSEIITEKVMDFLFSNQKYKSTEKKPIYDLKAKE